MKPSVQRGLRWARRWLGRLKGDESGQATVEYSIITAAMIVGGTVSLVFFIPKAIEAYSIYTMSYYWVLSLPFP